MDFFADRSVFNACRLAPWMRIATFAVWAPGRTPHTAPHSQDEEAFMEFQWRPYGLLQWAVVQGRYQTAARAEDGSRQAIRILIILRRSLLRKRSRCVVRSLLLWAIVSG